MSAELHTSSEPVKEVVGEPKRDVVLEVRDLRKTYRVGFLRKKVEAVKGISFEVRRGEIFGLLGPNGAGKTTTLKTVLRLVFPTSGDVRIFGVSTSERESMKRVGYMPENPYVYQYLKPLEFLDLCGRLVGMPRKLRLERSEVLVDTVGLRHAVDRPIGRFSKGMMQRIGLAQALLHDPELLILDEPMSGLDPIGRKEVRDVLLAQRHAGKTLIFTSHILSDVEMLCDRVAILRAGEMNAQGTLDELLKGDDDAIDIVLADVGEGLLAMLQERGTVVRHPATVRVTVSGRVASEEVLRAALDASARIVSVVPHGKSLESFFV